MNILQNVSLAPFTTFNIGGKADYFYKAESTQEIILAITFAKEKNIPFFVLGTGANILIGDKGFRGLIIKNEAKSLSFSTLSETVTVDSGMTIEELIHITAEKGLSGFEHFAGIPSSVGGACRQNLHFLAQNRQETMFIGDIVIESRIINSKLKIINVNKDYFKFDYDYSILHNTHDIILSATFKLIPLDPKIIKETIASNLKWRKEKHPENAAKCSAGSVFKKIERFGAGRLIEKVGLKGHKIGGAQISLKHANFIINTGNATAKDVRQLIDLVQKTVKQELNLDLQTEISFVGEF